MKREEGERRTESRESKGNRNGSAVGKGDMKARGRSWTSVRPSLRRQRHFLAPELVPPLLALVLDPAAGEVDDETAVVPFHLVIPDHVGIDRVLLDKGRMESNGRVLEDEMKLEKKRKIGKMVSDSCPGTMSITTCQDSPTRPAPWPGTPFQ